MKTGDTVRLAGEEPSIQQVWVVTNVKSTSKGLWLKLSDDPSLYDVWHNAKNYEVVIKSETR